MSAQQDRQAGNTGHQAQPDSGRVGPGEDRPEPKGPAVAQPPAVQSRAAQPPAAESPAGQSRAVQSPAAQSPVVEPSAAQSAAAQSAAGGGPPSGRGPERAGGLLATDGGPGAASGGAEVASGGAPGRASGGPEITSGGGPGGASGAPAAGAGSRRAPGSGKQKTLWRVGADGRTVFQMPAAVIVWWAWVVFAVLCLGDLAVQGRDRASLQVAVAIAAVTAFVYACTLRPKVVADDDGLTVHNPVRDHRVPWGAVTGIYLGDSVEIGCARPGRKDKTVYSWALYTRRRARARAELRAMPKTRPGRNRSSFAGQATGYGRAPAQAEELARTTSGELIAREIGRLREQAEQRGAPAGPVTAQWSWASLAVIAVPVAGLALTVLIR
ncbi:MAG: PH domain-containing protein [Streptosporangiaceae bacterium]